MHVEVTSFFPVLKDPLTMKGATITNVKMENVELLMVEISGWGYCFLLCPVKPSATFLVYWGKSQLRIIYLFILFIPLSSGQTRPQQQQYCML